jgi:hypothetical protein
MFLPNFNVNNMILSYRSAKGNASSRNLNNAYYHAYYKAH